MENNNLQLLKKILSIPSYFEYEDRVREFLVEYGNSKNYDVNVDAKGNVYFIKGYLNKNEFFPNVVAHIDTVFSEHIDLVLENRSKIIKETDGKLIAYHPDTFKRTGLGGDDLAGVYICLQLMEHFDNIKASFFVEEEFGYQGSSNCDDDFFQDVGYAIQFDAPTNNWYTDTLAGLNMFTEEFDDLVSPILKEANVDNYSADPYTDILALKEKFDFCCANLPTGYYNYHTDNEYVVIDDVQKGFELGVKFITKLGLDKYEYKLETVFEDDSVLYY